MSKDAEMAEMGAVSEEVDLHHILRRPGSWQVRFQALDETEHFADGLCGGKDAALAAAIEWRDRFIEQHDTVFGVGYDKRAEKEYGNPRKTNNSGVDGVNIFYVSARNSIIVAARWYDENKKPRKKHFSIGKKRTVEETLYQAAKARYELTGRADLFDSLEIEYETIRASYKELVEKNGLEVTEENFTTHSEAQ